MKVFVSCPSKALLNNALKDYAWCVQTGLVATPDWWCDFLAGYVLHDQMRTTPRLRSKRTDSCEYRDGLERHTNVA